MFKALASGLLWRQFLVPFVSLLLALTVASVAYARGKGPIAVWPASERIALVADASLPGLVLVDLSTGAAIERLVMDKMTPVGVASCPECDFALLTGGTTGQYWFLRFTAPVAELLQTKGRLDLEHAHLEPLAFTNPAMKLTDGRMCLVSDDGKTAFVAAMLDRVLVRLDLSKTPAAVTLIKMKTKPFGLNWDRNGDLLVTMHKRKIWRMTTDGKILALYDTETAGCPGTDKLEPNLRASLDDPINGGSLLILASNPKSYDAVVWRLTVDAHGKQSCSTVAGKIGHDPGWVDASGEAIEFSRPHYFAFRPNSRPPQLVITDIDNRALRLLNLATNTSTTLMYNRDLVVKALPPGEQLSQASCAELKWPTATAATGPRGQQFCVSAPESAALELTLGDAKAHCNAKRARLCEPAELLTAGLKPGTKAWTAGECASCWQRTEGENCAIAVADHKTPGITHIHENFAQSWNSGQALVFGASADGPAATLCKPVDEKLKAAAPCCADAPLAAG